MRRAVLLFVSAALLLPSAGAAAEPPRNAAVYDLPGVYTREARTLLVAAGYDVLEVSSGPARVVATPEEAAALALRGYRLRETPQPDAFPAADSNYHDYGEMVADVNAVAAAHPDTVRLFSLGLSYQGRDLLGARVSDDAADRTDEPGVVLVGQHHAREHLSVEVVLSLLHLFAESSDPQIRELVATRQIYIVPSLNPDGGEYDIATGSYVLWRKNRQPTPGAGYVGTDQNRNYSYRWGCCGGSSGTPSAQTYRGPSAFSTPETPGCATSSTRTRTSGRRSATTRTAI